MPFRVTKGGCCVECDFAGEAVALLDRLSAGEELKASAPVMEPVVRIAPEAIDKAIKVARAPGRKRGAAKASDRNGAPHDPDYAGFWSALTPLARDLLALLARHPEGLTTEAIVAALGVPATKMGPTTNSLRKQAAKHHLPCLPVSITIEDGEAGGRKQSRYRLASAVAEHLGEQLRHQPGEPALAV